MNRLAVTLGVALVSLPLTQSYSQSFAVLPSVEQRGIYKVLCYESFSPTLGSSGTGFLHESGVLVTASHVVEDCVATYLVSLDGDTTGVLLTHSASNQDIAVICPDDSLVGKPIALSLAKSFGISIPVSAWGYPSGYTGARPLPTFGYLSGLQPGRRDDLVRWVINADLNSGVSGGPIVDTTGHVFGMAVAKVNPMSKRTRSLLGRLRRAEEKWVVEGDTLAVGVVIAELFESLHRRNQIGIGHAVPAQIIHKEVTAVAPVCRTTRRP